MMRLNKDRLYHGQPIRFGGCNGTITEVDSENNILTIEMKLPASLVEELPRSEANRLEKEVVGE